VALDKAKLLICRSFERFGFVPLETPAVEPKEVLLTRGSIEKQIYTVAHLLGEQDLQVFVERAIAILSMSSGGDVLANYSDEETQREFGIETIDSNDLTILKVIRGLLKRTVTDLALHFDLRAVQRSLLKFMDKSDLRPPRAAA
jgi:hypothetical protein